MDSDTGSFAQTDEQLTRVIFQGTSEDAVRFAASQYPRHYKSITKAALCKYVGRNAKQRQLSTNSCTRRYVAVRITPRDIKARLDQCQYGMRLAWREGDDFQSRILTPDDIESRLRYYSFRITGVHDGDMLGGCEALLCFGQPRLKFNVAQQQLLQQLVAAPEIRSDFRLCYQLFKSQFPCARITVLQFQSKLSRERGIRISAEKEAEKALSDARRADENGEENEGQNEDESEGRNNSENGKKALTDSKGGKKEQSKTAESSEQTARTHNGGAKCG